MEMTTSEVLNKAADLIEQHGWSQFDGWSHEENPQGRLCLEGGIEAALGGIPQEYGKFRHCPAYIAVADYLGVQSVFGWNDKPGRTKEEVIEVLRAVALVEAAKEAELAVALP